MLISVGLIVIAAAVLVFVITVGKQPTGNVAVVNGEPVTLREFSFRLERDKGKVVQYFKDNFKAKESGTKFWNTAYNGETPLEYAKKQTLDECVRIKIQMLLAKDRGMIDDIRYATFLKRLEEENKKRKEAKDNGQTVYGLLSYEEESYFYSIFTDMVEQLKDSLKKEGVLAITEDEIKSFYEKNKNAEFKKQDYYKIQRIYAAKNMKDAAATRKAREEIEQLDARLQAGERFDKIAEEVKSQGSGVLKYEERIIDENTEAINYDDMSEAMDKIKKLPVNTVSGFVEELNAYNIVNCSEKRETGYKDLQDNAVKAFIEGRLLDEKYNQFIDGQVEKAKVDKNPEVYNRIKTGDK